MEPLDPVKNEEGSGFSKRRISSILKMPRKSIRLPEADQQDIVVECAKPVEKRISRRVSFAPANDVLLFSKDVKNTSPVRSPLQDLMSASGITQKRVHMGTEDQQITGFTPPRTLQQKDKVAVYSGMDFGEKTIMFSTDDNAFMDMTQCHTVHIGNENELLDTSHVILPTRGDRTMMFTADDGTMDMTLSQSVHMTCDQDMSILSKPAAPNVFPFTTQMIPGTKFTFSAGIDKENLAPKLMNKLVNKKVGDIYVCSVDPEDDMDMTEAQTGRIMTNTGEEDPLQFLFPQEISAQPDKTKSQTNPQDRKSTNEPTQTASKRRLTVNFDTKDDGDKAAILRERRSITTGFPATSPDAELDDPLQCLFPSQDMFETQQKDTKLQRTSNYKCLETSLKKNILKYQIDSEEDCREKTVRFSTDDACMDVTSCHTMKISTDFQQQSDLDYGPSASGEKTVRFTANAAGMDVTQCLTVNISSDLVPSSAAVSSKGAVSVQSMDFDNFLASISKVTAPKREQITTVSSNSAALQKLNSLNASLSLPSIDFENFLSSSIPATVPKNEQMMTKMIPNTVSASTQGSVNRCGQTSTIFSMSNSRTSREPSKGGRPYPDDDMNITETQTGRIQEDLFHHDVGKTGWPSQQQRSEFAAYNKGIESSRKSQLQKHQVDFEAEDFCRERTVRFAAEEALMDVTRSLTVNIATGLNQDLPVTGEKTVRFDINDAEMDVTQCHTVKISTEVEPPSHENLNRLPTYGEKTVRFDAFDATMDVTRCHTVKIDFEPELNKSLSNSLPKYGEKTVRFNAFDAAMDVTQSHTVKITTDIDPETCTNANVLPKFGEKQLNASGACMDMTQSNAINLTAGPEQQADGGFDIPPRFGEKTLRFNVNDATMDVTKALTVKIDVDEPQSIQDLDVLPKGEDKTVQFDVTDAGMEETQCLTSNIGLNLEATHLDFNTLPSSDITGYVSVVKKRQPSIYNIRRSRSLSAHSLNQALKSRRSVPWCNPQLNNAATPAFAPTKGDITASPSLSETKEDLEDDHNPIQIESAENSSFVFTPMDNQILQNEDCQEDSVVMNMTEVLTGRIVGPTPSEDQQQESIAINDLPLSAEEVVTEAPISDWNIEKRIEPDSPQINDNKNIESARKSECSPTSLEKDTNHSRKSRRMSLADIQSKMRRLSQMLTAAPDNDIMNCNTTPLLDQELNIDMVKTKSLPAEEPDLKTDVKIIELQPQKEEPLCTSATPFKLQTKQLMSRLSVVGFKPKLPQRSRSDEMNKLDASLAREPTKTLNVQNQLGNLDLNVSDINDEELGSYEDVSETIDTKGLKKGSEVERANSSLCEFELDQELQDDWFEEFVAVNEKKRPFPDDEHIPEDEKRMKTSNDTIILDSQTLTLECDDNITAALTNNTQSTDSSNCSQTASLRCEATFESTSKQSLFESQLEDYADDVQRKFDEGSLTMMEFFKLFHIDFVIHDPRRSVVPGRVSSDTDCTLMDFSKDRHISYPKQLVYEADIQNLTEQVDGLKVRMHDLDKPLILVNRTLWEEMEHFSEAEFRSCGVKLNERRSLFRKMSKAQSHEMKEVLYTNLVRVNEEEQKKLRGTIEKADAMLQSLDNCIEELEAELATVEVDVKSHQEELNKVTEALVKNETAISELEIQKKQALNKVKRVKDETRNLEKRLDMMNMINEWKLGEITKNRAVYKFLYETLHMEVVYEEFTGNDDEEEKKIANISFKHLFNDEKSQCHARLVHKLVSQFTQEQCLVKKYPTSKHIPHLLHEVSLVVSHCRDLGEELRLLKTWGSQRFDVLDLRCVDTEVHIVFSSLKRASKFEVVFSVSLTSCLCVLGLKSFKNIFGSTTIQNIEEIVASFTPARKYLTKIINKVHSSLLY